MTTATVAGVVKAPDGSAYASRPFVFELAVQHVTSSGGSVYAPERVTGTTSGAGAISVELLRGRVYSLRITTSDGIKYGNVTVPDSAGPFDLAALIDNGIVPVIPATPPTPTTAYQFASRAAFVSASLTGLADGTLAAAGGLFYVRTTGATAIADLPGWLPFGLAHVGHFGAVGTASSIDDELLVLTVPSVDETTRLQAAMDWCLLNGRDLTADTGRVYGITSALLWARTASVEPVGTPTLSDLNTCAIGGTWTAGNLSDPDPENWTFGPAMLVVGRASGSSGKYGMSVKNISCNGNRIARTGIWFRASARNSHDVVKAYLCTDCQIRVGDRADGSNSSCTDMVLKNGTAMEWPFSSDPVNGYNSLAARTSVGISQESSDTVYEACTAAVSRISLVLRGEFFNVQFTGCKFWNGPVRTDPNSVTVFVTRNANVYQFTGCRFDDGQVRVENFNGQFVGNRFIQFGSGHLRMVSTVSGETATRFVFVGNILSTGPNEAIFETRLGGSWIEFRGNAQGNRGNTGPYTIGGVGAQRGQTVVVADNGVATVNVIRNAGYVTLTAGGAENATLPRSRFSGFFYLGMGTTPEHRAVDLGADLNLTLGTLTGTTGTSGKVTVSPQADGTFMLENRGGVGSLTFLVSVD